MDGDDVIDGVCVNDGDCVNDGTEDAIGDGDSDGVSGFGSTSILLHVVVRVPGMSHPIQQVLGKDDPSSASYHEH